MNERKRELLAELLGTFILVLAGTGAIVINQQTGALGHVGIALTFGLVVMALIHTFGDLSGAHLNPAVTLGFAAAGRFSWVLVPGYVIAQIAGALAASAVLRALFPEAPGLGATLPLGSEMQSFWLEIFLTWFLMLAILNVSCGAKEKGITAGIAIGGIIGLEAMFAGPICGASMNPARSLAPAIVGGQMAHLWIYLTAPVLGAMLAVPTAWLLRGRQCCGTDQS
jgi:aquaporin NIP